MTVEELFAPFAGELNGERVYDLVSLLTDGELKLKSVFGRYDHWHQLGACCQRAIAEFHDKDADRFIVGNIMGRAMELLMKDHQLQAPKAWVPVMKLLRKGGKLERPAAMIRGAMDEHAWQGGTPSE